MLARKVDPSYAHAELNEVGFGVTNVLVVALGKDQCFWALSTAHITIATFASSDVRKVRVMRGPSGTGYGDDDAIARFRD